MLLAELILLLLLPPLLAVSALCSGSETALFSLTHSERVRLSKASPVSATAIGYLLAHPRQLLVSILVLNTCVNTAYFVITSELARKLHHPLWSTPAGIAAVVVLILAGEVIPKVLASSARFWVARRLGRAMLAVFTAIVPARVLLEVVAVTPLTRLLRPEGSAEASAITPDELAALLDHGAARGAIDEDEQRLLAEVVQLGTTRIRDAMIPRVDIRWLDAGASAGEFLDLVRTTGYTRLPVADGSTDTGILGWADIRRYLAASARGPTRIADILEPVLYVPDRARLDQLLEEFRRRRTHIALCVDEFGAVTGLVHIRHVVGELLANPLESAHAYEETVVPMGDGRWLVPGRLGVRDWFQFLGPAAPRPSRDGSASTVAGLVLQSLGRVPRPGDIVRLGNVTLEIASMRGPVIERVTVSVAPAEAGA